MHLTEHRRPRVVEATPVVDADVPVAVLVGGPGRARVTQRDADHAVDCGRDFDDLGDRGIQPHHGATLRAVAGRGRVQHCSPAAPRSARGRSPLRACRCPAAARLPPARRIVQVGVDDGVEVTGVVKLVLLGGEGPDAVGERSQRQLRPARPPSV